MQIFVTYAKPVIDCIKCGQIAEAGNMSIDQWCHSMDQVHRIVNAKMPDIPVGWSSNGWKDGRRDLRCVQCTG